MTVSTEFAELLRAGRPQFNTRVAEARHRYPGFNTDTLSHFLQDCVDPLIGRIDPVQRGAVCSAAFDIALDLVGRELAGGHARGALIQTLWQEALPALVNPIASRPAPVLSAFCNALLNLEALPAARPVQWIQLLRLHGATLADPDALLQLGVLAAWRAGAAHFRLAALRAAAKLPDIARAVLELPLGQDVSALLRVLEQNPWLLAPAGRHIEVGGFTGFGGHFTEPPQIRSSADGFHVKSGDRYFLLIADCFGAVFLPASQEEFNGASPNGDKSPDKTPRLQGSTLIGARANIELNLPAAGLQLAWNSHSAAVSSPYSFSICVAPWA